MRESRVVVDVGAPPGCRSLVIAHTIRTVFAPVFLISGNEMRPRGSLLSNTDILLTPRRRTLVPRLSYKFRPSTKNPVVSLVVCPRSFPQVRGPTIPSTLNVL